MRDYTGLGVAMVTPFTNSREVDYPALKKLTQHLITSSTDYLVVQGTTAETATLTNTEKQKVLETIVETNNGKLPVVLGMGGNNTHGLIDEAKNTKVDGVDAFLTVSPYYNKPTQEGIYQHFKTFSESTDKDIIAYNVPGRTGSNMLADTTLRIANDCKNIIAIKEASGDLEQLTKILKYKPNNFKVLSGDDGLSLPSLVIGVEGIISVIGNALPAEFSKLIHLCLENKYLEAKEIYYQLSDLIPLLFKEGNPAGVKALLKHIGVCENYVRLPLVDATQTLQDLLKPYAK